MFHSTLPTPNNNIAIILNHTVLSQPPWGKAGTQEWIWIYLYIAERGWPKDYIFGIHLSSFEEKKKKKCCHTLELHIWFALRKLCSQLLCASGSFGESLPGECEKGCLFSLSLCASICQLKFKWLAWEWEKRKANLESKKKKKVLTVCELIFGGGKQCGERRGKVWSGKRTCCKS